MKTRIEATILIEYPYDLGTEFGPVTQAYYRLMHSVGEEIAAMFLVIFVDRISAAKIARHNHELMVEREHKIAEAWWPFNWLREAIRQSRTHQ